VTGRWISMRDACGIYGISEGTARRWARGDTWARAAARPKMYRLADVQASYDKRRAPGARVRQHLIRAYCQPAAWSDWQLGITRNCEPS
jgi:hypothetical protein